MCSENSNLSCWRSFDEIWRQNEIISNPYLWSEIFISWGICLRFHLHSNHFVTTCCIYFSDCNFTLPNDRQPIWICTFQWYRWGLWKSYSQLAYKGEYFELKLVLYEMNLIHLESTALLKPCRPVETFQTRRHLQHQIVQCIYISILLVSTNRRFQSNHDCALYSNYERSLIYQSSLNIWLKVSNTH